MFGGAAAYSAAALSTRAQLGLAAVTGAMLATDYEAYRNHAWSDVKGKARAPALRRRRVSGLSRRTTRTPGAERMRTAFKRLHGCQQRMHTPIASQQGTYAQGKWRETLSCRALMFNHAGQSTTWHAMREGGARCTGEQCLRCCACHAGRGWQANGCLAGLWAGEVDIGRVLTSGGCHAGVD